MGKGRILWWVFLVCLVLGWRSSAYGKTYQIGVFLGLGGTQDVQGAELLRSVTKVFVSRLKMKANYQVYSDEKKFIKDIRSRTLDMAFTTKWDVFFGPMWESGFRPSITLKYFNTNEIPNCLFVSVDSPYKSVKELKNKRVSTYTSQTEYFTLRNFIGGKPEVYFSPLVTFPNSISGLYQLSLGTTDAAYINRGVYQFLSLTNPGVGKQLKALGCGKGYYSPPFSMGPGINAAEEKRVIDIIKNLPNDPEFSSFRPLARGMKASFIPVQKKHYLPMLNLRKEGVKLRWHLDHKKWLEEVTGIKNSIKASP